MKKSLLFVLVVAAAALFLSPVNAKDVPRPELVSGEVISLSNYMMKGLTGEENLGSSLFHSDDHGLPVAILDRENGQLFIAVGKRATSPNPKLLPLMGKMVNAQGPVYRSHGVQLIELQIVAEQ